jgi:ornithine decarboxylase
VFCQRPHAATRAARWFSSRFSGRVFYAVKANPSAWLLDALIAGGIDHFDTASIAEVRLVRSRYPDATISFMNPVKSFEAINEAYHSHGVRIFSLDSQSELDKIVEATGAADDLTLCVRLKVPGDYANISLANKFGIDPEEAIPLLQHTRQAADALGICFHVGSQTMSPIAYGIALDRVQETIVNSGVIVDAINVGGGFPSHYPGMFPPPLELYLNEIERRFETMLTTQNGELWCEPGRALAAESTSLVVRVEGRRDQHLFINDGVFGALYDAGAVGWNYPVRRLGQQDNSMGLEEFSFYGPTCDDADVMQGPFLLPDDIKIGDYIEIGMLGAYGTAMRTNFNGFMTHQEVMVADEPMSSMYVCSETAVSAPVAATTSNRLADQGDKT